MDTKSLKELMDLSGRVALVTGGGGHIGRVICETLCELNCNVAIHDLDLKKCREVEAKLLKSYRCEIKSFQADLIKKEEIESLIPEVIKNFSRLDILIHCAAFVGTTKIPGWAVPLDEQSIEAFEAAIRVNLSSAFLLSKNAYEFLKKNKKGSIVFISSIYSLVAPDFSLYKGTKMANPAGYGCSKAGLNYLTKYLASAFAPSVRVNSISLGGIFRNQNPKFVKRYEKKTLLGRMGREEDIKGAIAFLASDLSSYVTGENIVVDGGFVVK